MNEKLIYLSWVANRSTHQLNFLYELCGKDFDKLLKVEAVCKRTFYYGCPNDVEEVEMLCAKWDEIVAEEERKAKNKTK